MRRINVLDVGRKNAGPRLPVVFGVDQVTVRSNERDKVGRAGIDFPLSPDQIMLNSRCKWQLRPTGPDLR